MRLTKERTFDHSAGLKCRMGGLVVDHDGPSIYTTNKRDCTVVRINRESKIIDTIAKTTDKTYAYARTCSVKSALLVLSLSVFVFVISLSLCDVLLLTYC